MKAALEIERNGQIRPVDALRRLPPGSHALDTALFARRWNGVARGGRAGGGSTIISNPYADPRAVELDSGDFTAGGLPRTTYAPPGKLFTANENLFQRLRQRSEL